MENINESEVPSCKEERSNCFFFYQLRKELNKKCII